MDLRIHIHRNKTKRDTTVEKGNQSITNFDYIIFAQLGNCSKLIKNICFKQSDHVFSKRMAQPIYVFFLYVWVLFVMECRTP